MRKIGCILALGLLVVIGLFFRWRYATNISLFIDEFTTMWAARQILDNGVPIMPSGVLYTRGLLSSYVEAAFLAIHFSRLMARVPSILLGLVTILATYMVGRHHFDWRVGIVAAALITLAPEEIVWSGRARFYIQLQLFVLLAGWAAFESIKVRKAAVLGPHVLFALFFVLALFSQEETILLYPAFLLATVLWQGVDFFRQRVVLVAHFICVVAMGVRYAIEKIGQPGYFETIQAQRPYVGLGFDIWGALNEYADFFITPSRLPLMGFVLVAAGVMLYELVRRSEPFTMREVLWSGSLRLHAIEKGRQATLFYLLLFLVVFAIIVIFVGHTWREMRYIFLLVPFWFLVAAQGAVWLMSRALRNRHYTNSNTAGTVVLAVGALLLFLPEAREVITLQQVEGYDLVLDYIAEQREPGDAILTPQPPSCAIVLGPCDYYAIQKHYEEYVIRRDGQLVDRWSGAPLLNSDQQLREVIASHPTTYFMVDGYRLATRYEPDFLRTIVEQMDKIYSKRGVSVLRAQGLRPVPDLPIIKRFEPPINFGNEIGLSAVELSATILEPSQPFDIMLIWTSLGPVWGEYHIFAHLIGQNGQLVAQNDGPPVKNILPTWLFGPNPNPDPRQLQLQSVPPGRYRLLVGLYHPQSGERLQLEYGPDAFEIGVVDVQS